MGFAETGRVEALLQSAQAAAHRHPKRVAAAVAALLAGTAITAFGVAPLTASDLPQPPVTVVEQGLPLPHLARLAGELDQRSLPLYRSELTRSSDTVDSLLRRLGVMDAQAADFLRTDAAARAVLNGAGGRMVRALTDNGRLLELTVRGPAADAAQGDTHFTRLTVTRHDAGLHATLEQAALEVAERVGSGTISSSLFAAADEARIPDAVTNQMAEMFAADIDFRRELRKGDAFTVVYEALMADGEPVTWGGGAGRVLAARFINQGKVHDAVWFAAPGRKGAYFDLNGRSKVKAFLASPVAFSRVTSGFAMRFHPIHHTWRAHLGVDYGAPTGTPVRVVGDGVVTFSGWQNGYGNVVHVEHSGNRTTVYAHLSRIDVRRGQRVEQGTTLGAVGATGWATGPHLHFEFKVGNRQVDPMTMVRAAETVTLDAQSMGQFRRMATQVATRLDLAGQMQTAGLRSGPAFE